MLTRRLISSASSTSSPFLRTFTSSTTRFRAPALADITPDNADTFNARQKEFREGLEAARERKRQQDSQSVAANPSSSSTSTASNAYDESSNSSALGSLSTFDSEQARENPGESSEHPPKKKSALSSLIYGTKEGQQMDQEIEKSFSQVLARGKYMHSIVFHKVKPDKVDEYVDLVGSWYPRMAGMSENKVNLVGSWRTEVGDCDTFGMLIPKFPDYKVDLADRS